MLMTKTPNKTPELSLSVQYGTDDQDLPRWRIRRWVLGAMLAADLHQIDHVMLTVRLVDKHEGRQLNQTYRHKDYATNVLTFEYDADPNHANGITADIVICTPVLRQEAQEQGKPYLNHAAHLVVHGTLHALGYDHLNGAEAQVMESLETRTLARWRITDPYAAR